MSTAEKGGAYFREDTVLEDSRRTADLFGQFADILTSFVSMQTATENNAT